ncbi:acyl-CoA dehydrogenase family protein [Actinacidiphila sp. ITFR-21]|uniref:acyl-CoA dehydrogenase family protein n=1 Tax=Actinacidiphila sp. ITFR-21 TaxID=3075199 RepID=UPI00288A13CB|nr:acyl-CoA dehydrogenase family protein [Streptomyces sp. ITFR-21]WNI18788.1 acyl-CoA dehydrogenase family protein [Streptomyces sp. ITFR-21]
MDFSPSGVDAGLVEDLDRRFQSGIAVRAAEADATGRLSPESWQDIVDSGYLRVFHPKEIGGLGVDGVTQAQAMETLARACAGTYWSATMSTLLCGKLISTYGNIAEHQRLLTPILSGEQVGCFAVVERTSGSDAGTYRTRVSRAPQGDGYIINGEKARITNAPNADLAVVLARFDGDDSEQTGAQAGHDWCFAFVDLRQAGVGRYDMPHMGLRAMPWGGVTFENVPIRREDVVPVPYTEFAQGMAWGWLFISVAAIATAENALRETVRHASQQVAFGRPLIHMEGVQAQLAQARAEIDAARLLAWRTSWHRAEGRSVHELIAILKATSTETAVRVTQAAVQIHGSWALGPGHPVERYYRDAPMNVIGGFTSNRLRELVAESQGMDIQTYQDFDWLAPAGLTAGPGEDPATSLVAVGGEAGA